MNDTIESLDSENNEHKTTKAAKGKELATLKVDLNANRNELKSQETKNAAKEEECKFLMDNFDIRLQHMNDEIDALNEAKSFLKGMK